MSSANPAASGCRKRVGAAIMASGTGSRFGSNKLLDEFEGRPLFEWVFDAVSGDLFERVVVVTPYDEITQSALRRGFTVVYNDTPEDGQARTIRLATDALQGLDAGMFCVCDQPYMSRASLRRLVSECGGKRGIRTQTGRQAKIWALEYDGRRGNPVLFSSEFFEELRNLSKDETGAAVIRRHMDALSFVPAECATELMDIDSRREKEDLEGVTNFFLTGPRHAGKSTLLRRTLKRHHITATGIITVPYFIDGVYTGYQLHALSNRIDRDWNDRPISVFVPPDGCIPVPQTFSVFGTGYLEAAWRDSAPLVLLDELGRLETPAKDFQEAVLSLLGEARPVVGVLKDESIPWLYEIRSRHDTRVVRVEANHREEAARELERFLQAQGLCGREAS